LHGARSPADADARNPAVSKSLADWELRAAVAIWAGFGSHSPRSFAVHGNSSGAAPLSR